MTLPPTHRLTLLLAALILAPCVVTTAQHLVYATNDPYPLNPARTGDLTFEPTAVAVWARGSVIFAAGGEPSDPIDPQTHRFIAYDGRNFSRFEAFSDAEDVWRQAHSLAADEEGNVAAVVGNSTVYSVLEYWDGTATRTLVANQTPFPGAAANRVLAAMRIGDVRAGKVAFFAGANNLNNEQGLFIADGTSITPVVRTGDTLPGMTAPFENFRFQSFSASFNEDASKLAFFAAVRENGVELGRIYQYENGACTPVVDSQTTLPEGPMTYLSTAVAMVGDAVLFTFGTAAGSFLAKHRNGSITILAKTGDPGPAGTPLDFFSASAQYNDGLLLSAWVGNSYQLYAADAAGNLTLGYAGPDSAFGNFFLAKQGAYVGGRLVLTANDWNDSQRRLVYTTAFDGPGGKAADLYPFSEGTVFAGGFRYVPWLGWIYDAAYPFVYHFNYGWIHVPPGSTAHSLWYYDFGGLGWGWTARGVFPSLWHAASGIIYTYQEGSTGPRTFVDGTSGATVTEQQIAAGSVGPVDLPGLVGQTITLGDGVGQHTLTLTHWNGSLFDTGTLQFRHQGSPIEFTVASGVYTETTGILWIQAVAANPLGVFAGSQVNFYLDLKDAARGYQLSYILFNNFINPVAQGQNLPGTYSLP